MSEALSVFIGYDQRQDAAYRVCRNSILRRCSRDVHIVKLAQEPLRAAGLYSREWRDVNGQWIDCTDGKPFSTEFTFTRFLVPLLALRQGWALFCDCDFLFTADLACLFDLADDRYAVMVVKHEHKPREKTKMTGAAQTSYRRKNWSSLVLWNCEHAGNRAVTTWGVNHLAGHFLHAFSWLGEAEIGALPATWNHLSGVGPAWKDEDPPCGIHYTLGTADMPGHEAAPFADLWLAERDSRRGLNGPTMMERARALDAKKAIAAHP